MERQDSPAEDPAGRVPAGASRRAFLALGAAGVAGAAAGLAGCSPHPATAGPASPARTAPRRRVVPENSRPGDPHWEIRHLGAPHAIEGYAGASSVLTGESFPLFVSSEAGGFRVTAFRLGWYGGTGAVVARDSWVFAGTGGPAGARLGHLVGIEYDRVNPAYPVPRPIEVLSHSPLICQGVRSFADSAYCTHPGGGRRLQRGHHALGGGDLRRQPARYLR
jgi:hypothetical protein